MTENLSIKCLGCPRRPDCGHIENCRGLCNQCYVFVCKMVREGRVTWAELESQGKAKPAKRRVPPNERWR